MDYHQYTSINAMLHALKQKGFASFPTLHQPLLCLTMLPVSIVERIVLKMPTLWDTNRSSYPITGK